MRGMERGAVARRGSVRTGWRAWLLAVVLAVATPLPAAAPPLPPQEAFEEYPGYDRWRVVSVELSKKGAQIATIRLVHPDGDAVAVLHYRLLSSSVFEAPSVTAP